MQETVSKEYPSFGLEKGTGRVVNPEECFLPVYYKFTNFS
jgi:hypothetical protein